MSSARYTLSFAVLLLAFLQLATPSLGQVGISYDIKKPKEFENRVLRSEKSDRKKFKLPTRFIQNTISHYNYFFNANNKLNEVMTRAKSSFRDDYSQLIPFYNYTLDVTAADSIQLDSISFKAQTGIVLHDLRSDWADNLYLLWGESYYLQKQFDSAYLMFQFINYAFADKEKDGYYRVIGSARDGNNAFNISTREKNSFTRRIFTTPPSRNDAFVWQIRTYLEQDQYAQAASLVQALQNDPNFPDRLRNDLEEVQAYSFYRQKSWDSAAAHLENALGNASNKQEKARWEYLLGQLYEKINQYDIAGNWYAKSIGHTTDPLLDIYARLASVRVNKDGGEHYIDKNVATLAKMAKRDKYQDYRDIIYYMAAQMELERNHNDAALALLLKSTKYTANNPEQRNKAFLQLAELSFLKRQYRQSYNFYDSLRLDDPTIIDPEAITARKAILERLAGNIEIISRQDSLQHIASLPPDERRDLVKKITRQLRRQQGLKDEGVASSGAGLPPLSNEPPPSLFADKNKKGEWYFYNTASRQKGLTDFQSKWGKRSNSDNWRRSAAQTSTFIAKNKPDPSQIKVGDEKTENPEPTEITFEGLYENLPLTDEKMQQSNDSIQQALFHLGVLYVQELEDCSAGTQTLEELRTRFPKFANMDEVLFNLYYCYNKNGETERAAELKNSLTGQFKNSRFTGIVNTGKDPKAKGPHTEATATYEQIYDLFLEGNFAEAIARKRAADSTYGPNYWTPQLLYIESVYYIKQRDDSTAKLSLNNLISQFAGTPMAAKATTLLDVLSRRQQIEEELRNLVINMPAADSSRRMEPVAVVTPPVISKPIGTPVTPAIQMPVNKKDSITVRPLPGAIANYNPPKKDTVATAKPVIPPPEALAYAYIPDAPHYVVIVLNKIDPIFVNEARNAFARYNRDTYYNKQMQAELIEIDADNRLLLLSPFKDAAEALDYVDKTKPKTATEIIPWLKGGKYSYSIITDRNLELLKNSKDIDKYKAFIEKAVPGKL